MLLVLYVMRRGNIPVTSLTLISYFTLLFMLKLEVTEMYSYVLLFGLDLHKSKKGLTYCDGINKYSFIPICSYQIRTVFKKLFPSLN